MGANHQEINGSDLDIGAQMVDPSLTALLPDPAG
jgi:hypothetical protein